MASPEVTGGPCWCQETVRRSPRPKVGSNSVVDIGGLLKQVEALESGPTCLLMAET